MCCGLCSQTPIGKNVGSVGNVFFHCEYGLTDEAIGPGEGDGDDDGLGDGVAAGVEAAA